MLQFVKTAYKTAYCSCSEKFVWVFEKEYVASIKLRKESYCSNLYDSISPVWAEMV
jgi:hypothetical protein